jgi:hypothetical protein
MLILASATDKLQIVTGSAGQINVHASYLDNIAGTVVPGRKNTQITTATTTDVVLAPAGGTYRNLKTMQIYNAGAGANTVILQHTDGATAVQLHQVTLGAQATLQYIDEIGFLIAAAPISGAHVLIASQVVTTPVPSIQFTAGIDATYDEYEIHILALRPSADDFLKMRISQDNGATWKQGASNYVWTTMFVGYEGGAPTFHAVSNIDTGMLASPSMSASAFFNLNDRITMVFPASSSLTKHIMGDAVAYHPALGICRLVWGGMYYADTNPINGIQFLLATGGNTIAGGTIKLYGIAK